MYSLTLEVGQDTFKGEGETAEEAIINFVGPVKIPAKGLLTFEKDGKKKTVFVNPVQIKRIPMKISRIVLVKQFEYGLK